MTTPSKPINFITAMTGSTAQDFIPNEAYEDNLARRGDDGDSVNDINYERTGEMLREVLPFACSGCKERMKTKGLNGLWHCWFRLKRYDDDKKFLAMFDRQTEPEIAY